jgi:hypothetical protein
VGEITRRWPESKIG